MQQAQVRVFDEAGTQLGALRAKVNELRLRASDLAVKKNQLNERRSRLGADVDPSAIEKQVADVEHEFAATHIQIDATNQQIHDIEMARDAGHTATIVQPAPESFPRPQDIITMWTSGVVLLLPFVLVLARRLWVRGVRREPLDLENSPRLQRIEQAVESIAIEVERIGEAQRFTTRLLAERPLDAAARIPVQPRREPGTITPH